MKKKGLQILSVLLTMILMLASVPVVAGADTVDPDALWDEATGCEYEVLADDTVAVTCHLYGGQTTYTIPGTVAGRKVTVIKGLHREDGADCSMLETVIIPNTVTGIGERAFTEWPIKNIKIPDSVVSIGARAFETCILLTEVNIPAGVTRIGEHAFDLCVGMSRFTVDGQNRFFSNDENGILYNKNKTELVQCPFNCLATEYALPASVETIRDGALFGTGSITRITVDAKNKFFSADDSGVLFNKDGTKLICCPMAKEGKYSIPNQVKSIGRYSFGFTNLQELTIPNGVTEIDEYAFCYALLPNLTIPNSVTRIAPYAFYISSLTAVTIPGSVKEIEEYAFWNCLFLEEVRISNGVEKIDYGAFEDCTALTKLVLPNTLKTIDCYAFAACSNLPEVTIPNGITVINAAAFAYCQSLAKVVIPVSVQYIDEMGLPEYIEDIYYCGTPEQWQAIEVFGVEYGTPSFSAGTIHYNYVPPVDPDPVDPEPPVDPDPVDPEPPAEEHTHVDENHDGICDTCGEDLTLECTHICHRTNGFSQAFYKIMRFFWKLFGIERNRYCACGKAHW